MAVVSSCGGGDGDVGVAATMVLTEEEGCSPVSLRLARLVTMLVKKA